MIDDVALIFEGGGMRASQTAAVVVALLKAGLDFGWAAGISAGASHLVNYLSGDAERSRKSFVEFADDPQIGGYISFLRGKGLFNSHYIYEQAGLPGGVLPFDFAAFAAHPARRRIGAFEAESGRTVYWSEADLRTLPDLMRRVRASSTMPMLMPPTLIDGQTYFDGAIGVNGGIALDVARGEGFRRFFVVLTRERAYIKPPARLPAVYRAWFRRHPAVADGVINRWRHYNQVRQELFDLERDGQALVFAPDVALATNRTRSVPRLRAAYDAGWDQAQRELPRWRDFLGR